MAPTVNTTDDFIMASKGKSFTFEEAIEFLKILDTLPTGSQRSVRWVESETKKPVIIGYTGSDTQKKKVKKTSPIPPKYYKKYRNKTHSPQFIRVK